jgi:hypothetical protein
MNCGSLSAAVIAVCLPGHTRAISTSSTPSWLKVLRQVTSFFVHPLLRDESSREFITRRHHRPSCQNQSNWLESSSIRDQQGGAQASDLPASRLRLSQDECSWKCNCAGDLRSACTDSLPVSQVLCGDARSSWCCRKSAVFEANASVVASARCIEITNPRNNKEK